MTAPLAPCPYRAVLDAGDRLADALDAGDLDAARAALDDRQRAVDAAAPDRDVPEALAERLRRQDERIARALRAGLAEAGAEAGAAGRTAHAHGRYHGAGRAPVLDTAPRTGAG